MNARVKKLKKLSMVAMASLLLVACQQKEEDATNKNTQDEGTVTLPTAVTYDENEFYQDWKTTNHTTVSLDQTTAKIEGEGADFKDKVLTISKGGVYVLSGVLKDGRIVVEASDDTPVRLVFNGIDIEAKDNAAIFVKQAKKTIISLEKGTKNRLSDGETYSDTSEDAPNATIFSKDDLVFNGTGSLDVKGNFNNAIVSKDDLKIIEGTISVASIDDGIIGKDVVAIQNGTIQIDAKGDGIRSTNSKEEDKGFVQIDGGNITINALQDAIQAETSLLINDGTFEIIAGTGSKNAVMRTEGFGMPMDRKESFQGEHPQQPERNIDERPTSEEKNMPPTQTETVEKDEESTKGLKAGTYIVINNGTLHVDAYDDAIHANKAIALNGGTLNLAAGDDGVHADESLLINGAKVTISKSYEGLESARITLEDGVVSITSEDDGVNANEQEASVIDIRGGSLTINAKGDGIDSNGSITMTDGHVLVSGPTNNGNGSLDFDKTFDLTGGTLVASGSAGMLQVPSDSSTQPAIMMTFSSTLETGSEIRLADNKGNTVASVKPEKEFQTVLFSTPTLEAKKEYTLYNNEEAVVTFTLSEGTTWVNEEGVTEAKQMNMPGGMKPDGNREKPTEMGEKAPPAFKGDPSPAPETEN